MSHSTRRTFLQASALSAIAATRAWGANDRINVGIVGIGGRGTDHIKYYAKQPDARICRGLRCGPGAPRTRRTRSCRS